ncbi:hypothetical protein I4F81_005831 [Pyropia yezoensis]|uniref:Uncharacterized protein n=1 Tax=Pyropia yezoensis TaxID=2788 RepID=A0ACC3BZH6_PYRYE|nr:hypothetical protein I4F81_005831 [Neopyropia yezoensis]
MDIRLLTLYGNCVGLRDCLGLNLLVRPPTASARALLRRTSTLRSAAASHPSLGQLRRAACRSLPPPPTRSFERDDKPGVGRRHATVGTTSAAGGDSIRGPYPPALSRVECVSLPLPSSRYVVTTRVLIGQRPRVAAPVRRLLLP